MFFTDPEFAKIAEDHNTTPAQISISWLVQRGIPPLPKSANVDRMKSNKTVSCVAFNATYRDAALNVRLRSSSN